jgi:AcrR family transcriptional regulator
MLEIRQSIPKTEKGFTTFKNLMKAAEKLFHENSYHATSIEDITKYANVATGTFYLYFKSKKSLYKYLIYNYYHDIRKTIAEETKLAKNRLEAERLGLKSFINYVIKKPHAYTLIWQSLVVDKDLFIDYYSSFAKRYQSQIKDSQDRNEVAKSLDPLTVAYYLMGVSNFIGLQVILFSERTPDEVEINRIVDNAIQILTIGLKNEL